MQFSIKDFFSKCEQIQTTEYCIAISVSLADAWATCLYLHYNEIEVNVLDGFVHIY